MNVAYDANDLAGGFLELRSNSLADDDLLPDRVFFITGVALDMTVKNASRRPAFEDRFARIFGELILCLAQVDRVNPMWSGAFGSAGIKAGKRANSTSLIS